MNDHEPVKEYMRRAIELAWRGAGYTSPNPLVGAVIVKDGKVKGEGLHEKYGELHAERNALKSCKEEPSGADMYVTLEPCCHKGKQPPCTEAIIEAGIARVIVGSNDPNPKVAGKGIEILKSAGIEVVTEFLKDECDELNAPFFHYITTGTPFVTMKYAMTLDGKIATYSGKSKWITSPEAREYVHDLRGKNMAIMAGVGTVLADDPMLDTRYGKGLSPVRVICDTWLRTPLLSKVVRAASHDLPKEEGSDRGSYRNYLPKTIIATSVTDETRLTPYKDAGVHILTIDKGKDGHIAIERLLKELGGMGIDSLLCEGGAILNWSVLGSGCANRMKAFIAPKVFGGKDARSPIEGDGVESPDNAFVLENMAAKMIGSDFLLEGDIVYPEKQ